MLENHKYIQILMNCHITDTIQCEVCKVFYVKEKEHSCPHCRIEDKRYEERSDFEI